MELRDKFIWGAGGIGAYSTLIATNVNIENPATAMGVGVAGMMTALASADFMSDVKLMEDDSMLYSLGGALMAAGITSYGIATHPEEFSNMLEPAKVEISQVLPSNKQPIGMIDEKPFFEM